MLLSDSSDSSLPHGVSRVSWEDFQVLILSQVKRFLVNSIIPSIADFHRERRGLEVAVLDTLCKTFLLGLLLQFLMTHFSQYFEIIIKGVVRNC